MIVFVELFMDGKVGSEVAESYETHAGKHHCPMSRVCAYVFK